MIKNGQHVKDRISGFTGEVTGRFVWANGCVQLEVTAFELKDGKPLSVNIDEAQLEVVRAKKAKKAKKKGGSREAPARHVAPTRR